MATYLPRIERPHSIALRIAYFFTRRQMGKVPTPIAVFSARMPLAFLRFAGKISRLDRKLKLPAPTATLVREEVARTNGCTFCQDIARWFTMRSAPEEVARIDALPDYRTSPLFSDAERAALDYAAELTRDRRVAPETFQRLERYYSEREICDIVWLVARASTSTTSPITASASDRTGCASSAPRRRRATQSADALDRPPASYGSPGTTTPAS
jgi:alkylhydroperoxidase family enzyme